MNYLTNRIQSAWRNDHIHCISKASSLLWHPARVGLRPFAFHLIHSWSQTNHQSLHSLESHSYADDRQIYSSRLPLEREPLWECLMDCISAAQRTTVNEQRSQLRSSSILVLLLIPSPSKTPKSGERSEMQGNPVLWNSLPDSATKADLRGFT